MCTVNTPILSIRSSGFRRMSCVKLWASFGEEAYFTFLSSTSTACRWDMHKATLHDTIVKEKELERKETLNKIKAEVRKTCEVKWPCCMPMDPSRIRPQPSTKRTMIW